MDDEAAPIVERPDTTYQKQGNGCDVCCMEKPMFPSTRSSLDSYLVFMIFPFVPVWKGGWMALALMKDDK